MQLAEIGEFPAVKHDRHTHFERRFKKNGDVLYIYGAIEAYRIGARSQHVLRISEQKSSARQIGIAVYSERHRTHERDIIAFLRLRL